VVEQVHEQLVLEQLVFEQFVFEQFVFEQLVFEQLVHEQFVFEHVQEQVEHVEQVQEQVMLHDCQEQPVHEQPVHEHEVPTVSDASQRNQRQVSTSEPSPPPLTVLSQLTLAPTSPVSKTDLRISAMSLCMIDPVEKTK
jgi:hypothetical protein